MVVATPATQRLVLEQGARVLSAGRDRDGFGPQLHFGDRSCWVLAVADASRVTEPQLADLIFAPALYGAVRHQRTGVIASGVDAYGWPPELNDRDLKRVLVAQEVGVRLTELARFIAAPAAHVSAHEQCTGVVLTSSERDESRGLAVRFTTVSEHVVAIVAFFFQIDLAVATKRLLTAAFSAYTATRGTAGEVDAVGTTLLHEVVVTERVAGLLAFTTFEDFCAHSSQAVTTLIVVTFSEHHPLPLVAIQGTLVVGTPASQRSP